MKYHVLITGGARSGKSELAERRVASAARVIYLASGPAASAGDAAWDARVNAHRVRRPSAWVTHEQPDVADVLGATGAECTVLWDCASTWTAAHFCDDDFTEQCARVTGALRDTAATVVIVSSEVGLGVSPSTAIGNQYRDALGRFNRQLADVCGEVWFAACGRAVPLEPAPW